MRVLVIIAALGLVHCAETVAVNFDAGVDVSVPSPPPMTPGMACTPGMQLEVCFACDDIGNRQALNADARCPAVDCSPLDGNRLVEEGQATVCIQRVHGAFMGRCTPQGQCINAPSMATCTEYEDSERLRTDEVCRTIGGCDAGIPVVLTVGDGTPCANGQCVAGRCVSDAPMGGGQGMGGMPEMGGMEGVNDCARFPATMFCAEGTDNGVDYCEFLHEASPNENSCDAVCGMHDSVCLDAWDNDNNNCDHDGNADCDDEMESKICRCRR